MGFRGQGNATSQAVGALRPWLRFEIGILMHTVPKLQVFLLVALSMHLENIYLVNRRYCCTAARDDEWQRKRREKGNNQLRARWPGLRKRCNYRTWKDKPRPACPNLPITETDSEVLVAPTDVSAQIVSTLTPAITTAFYRSCDRRDEVNLRYACSPG
jgi:hypothetical protein